MSIATKPIYRIARRLVRKLTKPLRLRIAAVQLATSDGNIEYFKTVRAEAARLIAAEHRRQVQIELQRRQIAGW